MIKFIASLFTNKFELVPKMCKLVQRMTQSNQIIASLFSNKDYAIMSKHELKEAKRIPKIRANVFLRHLS